MKVAQSCLTLCDPIDYTVHGIRQARILDWVAVLLSRASSQPRERTQVSHIAGGFFYQLNHKGSPRIPEWVAYLFSRGSSQPRNQTRVSCTASRFFTSWATREAKIKRNDYMIILVDTKIQLVKFNAFHDKKISANKDYKASSLIWFMTLTNSAYINSAKALLEQHAAWHSSLAIILPLLSDLNCGLKSIPSSLILPFLLHNHFCQ